MQINMMSVILDGFGMTSVVNTTTTTLRAKSTRDLEKPSATSRKGKTGHFHDPYGTPFESNILARNTWGSHIGKPG